MILRAFCFRTRTKAALTLGVTAGRGGSLKYEVIEGACVMLRLLLASSTRGPRAFPLSGSCGGEVTAALIMRPSLREPGAIRIPSSGGEEPTAAAMRLSGDRERYEYPALAVKSIRWQQGERLRGDQERYAYPIPAVQNMQKLRSQLCDRLREDQERYPVG